ncbi:MAG: iron chelate uptake ABC transporter family permease subunit [Clostridiales bacterium]|uniref:iron chelate uptake ABC transporter family permease subunit n=1 Tax=Terrisporobacter sp. TaxID=1965305 RepID=UPI002A3A3ED4|nr:iron chelate uptake ABC transporter family permease subunit [Terrisporobacter sp.]MCI5630539.1 iron chelate uptake ABC transporter family permease subunit [Clostridium sp.]MDD5877911.1 iron chelate uptake ABC transporter family permease subunit [Clostridiales bacterium]MCI6458831.1 iron chelate uptake ABC transporter family permease subunit [Clostridium sp.]MCI7207384.1 iron chelate uptake ABC transporter family permease subunit [Clostridium sp.]MDD7755442.1 iron chelate uptake ABC transpor
MQANLERGSINKKSYTRKNKQNLNTPILVLSILILLSCVLFLTIDINPGHHEYALSKRVPKLIAIVLTGGCIGFSTIIFQTVTNNRILTPSVMGIDSLYVAVQTILMFVFGSTSIFVTDKRINFLICLVFMILGSLVLYKLIFKRENANVMFVLLIGMICGTLFSSISSFMQMVIDPNEYLVLQNKLFASFNNVNVDILLLGIIMVFLIVPFIYDDVKYYDVMSLGKDQSINLGLDYDKLMQKSFIIIAILISISTSLVGPLTFLGILVANITREMMKTYKHSYLLVVSILVSIFTLVFGQLMMERILKLMTPVSVVINMIGGIYFMYLLYKESKI